MTAHGWVTLVTCGGLLALFALAVARSGRSSLGVPLALLSVVMFASNLAALGFDLTRNAAWNRVDNIASPFTTPLALHFLLVFFGRRRQLGWLLALVYAAFGLLSLTTALALFVPGCDAFASSPWWTLLHLAGVIAVVPIGIALFVLHLRSSTGVEERQRTRLLFLAFLVLALVGTTDLWENLGAPIPRLGNVGTLAFAALLAVVALRLRLLDRDLSSNAVVFSAVLGALLTIGYASAFQLLATNTALLVLATVTLSFALVAAVLPWRTAARLRRERMQRLAITGRFTSQMAHDIKNPLAALKGAAQFLAEEHKQGRPLAGHGELISLLVEQAGRVETVVDSYRRLARVEPARQQMDLNALVRRVLALQHFAAGSKVELKSELAANLPACSADPDLIAPVLENLVRNAYEAMPQGGTLTVRTEPCDATGVFLSVEDTGKGMNSRTAERVFDDFFTTKETGTGLGLAFVRRVAEAHGGEISLTSREGIGTRVRLRLPIQS
jgi:two-component system sensor histidine kinase HydH